MAVLACRAATEDGRPPPPPCRCPVRCPCTGGYAAACPASAARADASRPSLLLRGGTGLSCRCGGWPPFVCPTLAAPRALRSERSTTGWGMRRPVLAVVHELMLRAPQSCCLAVPARHAAAGDGPPSSPPSWRRLTQSARTVWGFACTAARALVVMRLWAPLESMRLEVAEHGRWIMGAGESGAPVNPDSLRLPARH